MSTQVLRADTGLRFRRWFAARRPVVFRALSEADQLMRWWGPASCPVIECTVDFRPGGIWHYRLAGSAGGAQLWTKAVYSEIDAPERIAYVEYASDANGAILTDRPATYVTIRLDEADGGTWLDASLRYRDRSGLEVALRNGVAEGFPAALDQLPAVLTDLIEEHR